MFIRRMYCAAPTKRKIPRRERFSMRISAHPTVTGYWHARLTPSLYIFAFYAANLVSLMTGMNEELTTPVQTIDLVR
jgi:hypothetical protein